MITLILTNDNATAVNVNVNWGDGNTDTVTVLSNDTLEVSHTYQSSGQYSIKIDDPELPIGIIVSGTAS